MKKLGKKLSFLTKILLVIGLLISNLSSLSVVFAYEVAEDVVITLNEDILEINYTEKLTEEVEAVNVNVYENYTYSDGLSEEEVVTSYSLTAEQLLAASEGTLELLHNSIFVTEEEDVSNFKLFDGTYSAKVEIVDVTVYTEEESETVVDDTESSEVEETLVILEEVTEIQTTEIETIETEEIVLAEGTYEEEMLHESGLNIKLFDSTGAEISLVDGKYPVSAEDSKVNVVAQILSGGLAPNDIFVYNGEEYMASELIGLEFSSETEFGGRLFGEYELPIEVKVLKPLPVVDEVSENVETEITEVSETTLLEEEILEGQYEEVVYTDSVSILYESYELNAVALNLIAVSEGYGESYLFYSEAKEGILYVLSSFEEATASTEETVVTGTMLDVYNMLNVALAEDEDITYTLLKDGVNVLESYVPASEDDTIEAYLATVTLDDTVQVVLSNEGLTVTYDVILAGDLNNDNIMTEEDVLELINQVVGESEITDIDKSDLYGFDSEVNSLDVLYLNQVVNSKIWDASIDEVEATLNATLDVKLNGEELNEENYLTSGDEFTVDYVLSLTDYEVNGISGLFNYDETLFELVSVKVANEWLGNSYEGKFLYLGEESLTGPELETSEPDTELPEASETTDTENVNVDSVEEEMGTSIDYVVVTATFKALSATSGENNSVITLEDIELFNSTTESVTYYLLDQSSISTEAIEVTASEDNSLSYLEVAGIEIALEDGVYEYEITVPSDVTSVDLKYILGNVAASVTSEVYPEELAEGSNTIVITVTSESGVSQNYTITVIREEVVEETTTQVNYNNNYSNYENDDNTGEVEVTPGITDGDTDEEEEVKKESNLSRIVIIILILIVIAGLVYLIFKDDDDEETKKANKEVNKLKKQTLEPEVKTSNKSVDKTPNNNNKSSSKSTNNSKNKNSKNNSKNKNKER